MQTGKIIKFDFRRRKADEAWEAPTVGDDYIGKPYKPAQTLKQRWEQIGRWMFGGILALYGVLAIGQIALTMLGVRV